MSPDTLNLLYLGGILLLGFCTSLLTIALKMRRTDTDARKGKAEAFAGLCLALLVAVFGVVLARGGLASRAVVHAFSPAGRVGALTTAAKVTSVSNQLVTLPAVYGAFSLKPGASVYVNDTAEDVTTTLEAWGVNVTTRPPFVTVTTATVPDGGSVLPPTPVQPSGSVAECPWYVELPDAGRTLAAGCDGTLDLTSDVAGGVRFARFAYGVLVDGGPKLNITGGSPGFTQIIGKAAATSDATSAAELPTYEQTRELWDSRISGSDSPHADLYEAPPTVASNVTRLWFAQNLAGQGYPDAGASTYDISVVEYYPDAGTSAALASFTEPCAQPGDATGHVLTPNDGGIAFTASHAYQIGFTGTCGISNPTITTHLQIQH